MRRLEPGKTVTVSNPARGIVTAQVFAVGYPSELPTIEGAPPVDEVRQYLAELGIVQIATITYLLAGRSVAFIALGDGRGQWWDLKGQQLEIRPYRTKEPAPPSKNGARPKS